MSEASTIGLDLAKRVFQAHGADAAGKVVFRKRLRREQVLAFFAGRPACMMAMEACSSAHYWAREIGALGHTVRLIPPAYVKPFVKRQKNDTTGAEGICEAARRPTMRFVSGEERSSPGQCGCIPSSGSSRAAADAGDQRLARPYRGIWSGCSQRSQSRGKAHRTCKGSRFRFT